VLPPPERKSCSASLLSHKRLRQVLYLFDPRIVERSHEGKTLNLRMVKEFFREIDDPGVPLCSPAEKFCRDNIAVQLLQGPGYEISRRWSVDAVIRSSGGGIKRDRVSSGRAVVRGQ